MEIWNEWELEGTNPERLDATYYVEILKTAYRAIKSVNKKAEVVGMGGAIITSDGSFDEAALEAGVLNYCDALSIHVYDYHRMQYFPNQRVIDDVRERIDLYKSYMTDKEIPIYISETGWSTTTTLEDNGHTVYSEKEQAENLVKSFVTMKAYDLAEKMYWYDFQDDGEDETEREHRFGVVTSRYNEEGDLLAKPSYVASAAMNKIMSGGISKIENDKFQSYTESEKMWSIWGDLKRIDAYTVGAFSFERDNKKSELGKNVSVIWSKPRRQLKVSTGAKMMDCYDLYGNCETLYSENGIYDISIEDEIIYLSGDFEFFNVNNQSVKIEDVSYDADKNLLTVKGTSVGMKTFNIELCENDSVIQSEVCNTRQDGTFERVISVKKDGFYILNAGKGSIENYGKWTTPIEVKKSEQMKMSSQLGGVVVSGSENNIIVSGQLLNISKNEDVSVIVVSGGKDVCQENILYLSQITPDENSAFTDEISIPLGNKVVDIYVGANYADKITSEYSYDICRVISFNLEELDNNMLASAVVENITESEEKHTVIIAQYNNSGVLLGVASEEYSVTPDFEKYRTLTLSMPKITTATRCSAFIWDSVITPLYKNAEIEL